ncbi:MAG: succinate dehydrogenase/fumarate reductase iron-sulfur subunit [Ignavibacteria bacterium]|nr:succinate dehydrogenase/fumarate reductase iron-sulfur subunit [Ignavibacteria bacterium]
MNLRLHIWRQTGPSDHGMLRAYNVNNVSEHMSFLEMLDVLNEELIEKGEEPVAFDHDCREGICGTCGMVINGRPHGPLSRTTACQLHMRSFKDGDEIYIEPWRATAFPIVRDLVVDRSAFDRVIQRGGFVSVNTGNAQDGNAIPISKIDADVSMDAAACIGCGACVAACPNSSASLFVAAKIGHLVALPQGKAEAATRAMSMVLSMDAEGFGSCTNHYECEAACPKGISADFIAQMNREFMKSVF